MLFRALATASTFILTAPALAQLPAPLERALAVEPEPVAPEALVMRMGLGAESIRVAVSFEDEAVSYRLIEPASEEMLSEAQAEMWAGFNRDDDEAGSRDDGAPEEQSQDEDEGRSASLAFGSYDPAALREAIGDTADLIGEDEGRLIYEFSPQTVPGQEGAPDEMIENLRGEAVVDASRNELVAVRFVLDGSFKPHMAARINAFELEQRFVHEAVLGGPRTAGFSMRMAGSSLFQPFSQSMQFDFEDVRYPQADSSDG